jgi:transcriptional regulator GlxA family with amidase domain
MIESFGPNMPRPSAAAAAADTTGPIGRLPAGRPLRVAVLAFDRISPFHLAVPCVLFGDRHPGAPVFELRVCATEPGALRTTAGFEVHARHGLHAVRWADWVIVPSWRDPAERPPDRVLRALVAAHRRGALMVGLCLGAFLLAEAGLLDGYEATTHAANALRTSWISRGDPRTTLPSSTAVTCSSDSVFCSTASDAWMLRIRLPRRSSGRSAPGFTAFHAPKSSAIPVIASVMRWVSWNGEW